MQTGYVTGDYDTFTVTVKSGKRTDVKVEADAWQIALGYDYPLSKRTYLYAAASYVDRTYKEKRQGGLRLQEDRHGQGRHARHLPQLLTSPES
ncbi:MAG: porin [Sutterella wadsworthensis]